MAHGKPGNEHGSVFEFNGQWYVAYHDLFPTDRYRKTKLEFIHYTNSGDIPRVQPTDYGVGRYDGRTQIEAENYFDKSAGISYEDCTDRGSGFDVVGISDGSWLKFQKVDFGVGADSFRARVSASSGANRIEVHLGSVTGKFIGTCDVPHDDQTWKTLEVKLDNTISGVNDVVLVFKGRSKGPFKLNWIQFVGPPGASERGGGGSDGEPGDSRPAAPGGCNCTSIFQTGSPSGEVLISFLVLTVTASRRRRRRP